jgi:hypothetical protein
VEIKEAAADDISAGGANTEETVAEATETGNNEESQELVALYRGLTLDEEDFNVDVEGVNEGIDEAERQRFHDKL